MAKYKLLSESVNGKVITIDQTSTPGTLLHTSVSGESTVDIIRLVAHNISNASVDLTIEWGADDSLVASGVAIPANSSVPISVQYPLQNSLEIRAFGGSANDITITGEVFNDDLSS